MPESSEKNRTETPARPSKLGRGLSALLGSSQPVRVPVTPEPPKPAEAINPDRDSFSDLQSLAVIDIVPNKYQPRRDVGDSQLATLAASIKTAGIMQPVIVRPAVGGGSYEIVAGERRWRAAQMAGLTHVPALVRPLSDEQSAEWALVENIQREDLNAMDRARGLKSLCDMFGVSQADLAERLGLDRSTVANLIRLTELETEIATMISKNLLSAGHGKALLSAPAGAARIRLAREALERGYSVRKTETEAKKLASGSEATASKIGGISPTREAVLRDIEKRISQSLGTRVAIRTDPSGKRGHITLEFFDLDQFDGLLARLGVTPM